MNKGLLKSCIFSLLFLFIGCDPTTKVEEYVVQKVVPSDFEEVDEVSLDIHEDFVMTLWAPGPLLNNAVSLTFDPTGRAFVSETSRRKSSDIDIREHPDWMTEDIGLESLEDTKNFHMTKMATSTSNENTWQEDFNNDGHHDFRDLMVQSERVRIIEDTDQDGKADVSHIFADNFNDLLTGVAAGVLHHQNDIYLTCAPDVWRIQDNNGDGIADTKESISHGYGIHIAYAGHDMSGLTIGPDGKLYWSIGDMGVNTTDRSGRKWEFPHEGAIMRSNLDGSDFEVFAHGLRNPQELAFTAYGDLVTVDNDGDHPGEHERYVHVIEGSDAGWRTYWQFGKYNKPNEKYKVWTDEKLHVPYFKGQAAYITPPLALAPDGPCGLAYNPGNNLGPAWKDYFFATYFTGSESRSKVEAFKLQRSGPSLVLIDEKVVAKGIVPTGIEFGPAGDLFVNDWKSGYAKKPEGRIWKLNIKDENQKSIQKETFGIMNLVWTQLELDSLASLLGYHDQRIRLKAQFELVNRRSSETFESLLENGSSTIASIHAIWGLGQLGRSKDYDCSKLIIPLKEDNAEIRVQAAKVLGENKVNIALEDLLICLEDESQRVIRHAIEAIGKLGDIKAYPALIDYISKQDTIHTHMRHTLALALSRLDRVSDELAKNSDHTSTHVRMISVLALRQIHSNQIVRFIQDTDELILAEVARAIHDDKSIPEALPHLANALNQTKSRNPIFLRRAINANLRIGSNQSILNLKLFALDSDADETLRKEAIISLGYWSNPPVLDRVEGRYRKIDGHIPEEAMAAISDIFQAPSYNNSSSLYTTTLDAAGSLDMKELSQDFLEILRNPNRDIEVRISALNNIALLDNDLATAFSFAISSENEYLKTASLNLLSADQISESIRLDLVKNLLQDGNTLERQKSLLALASISSARDILEQWISKAIDGKVQPELLHEVLTAAKQSKDEEIIALSELYWNAVDSEKPLEVFQESLYGGNVKNGKQLFYSNPSIPCTQCHVISSEGGAAGPDLSTIGATLDRKDLLLSIVDPNARISPGYGNLLLTTKDQKTHVGMLQEENDQKIILKDPVGNLLEVSKNDIETRENLPSGMVSGANVLNKSDIRDLVEYMTSLK